MTPKVAATKCLGWRVELLGARLFWEVFFFFFFTMFKSKQVVFLMWKNWTKFCVFIFFWCVCVFFDGSLINLHWFWKLVGKVPGKFQTLSNWIHKTTCTPLKTNTEHNWIEIERWCSFQQGLSLEVPLYFPGEYFNEKKMWVSESCKRNHGPRPYITWLNQRLCGCQKLPKIGRRVSSKRTKSPTLRRSNPTSYEFKEAKLSCLVFFKNLKFPTMVFQGAPHKT